MYYSLWFSRIRKNLVSILFGALSFGGVAFLGLVFIPDAYKVRTDFLIIQQSASSQDFYTLSKSAEYSGNVLKEGILSDLFLREASQKGYFSTQSFSGNGKDRLKKWRDTVDVRQRTSAGILEVVISEDESKQALGIAKAVSEVLIEKNTLFRSGNPDDLSIRLISGPIVEQNPSISQLIFGILGGMILGTALSLLWIWYREEWDHTDYTTFTLGEKKNIQKSPEAKLVYDNGMVGNSHWFSMTNRFEK